MTMKPFSTPVTSPRKVGVQRSDVQALAQRIQVQLNQVVARAVGSPTGSVSVGTAIRASTTPTTSPARPRSGIE